MRADAIVPPQRAVILDAAAGKTKIFFFFFLTIVFFSFVAFRVEQFAASEASVATSRALLQAPADEPATTTTSAFAYSQRDAFLLAFFVGPWGAHRFYLAHYLSAAFQLALTIVFCLVNLVVRCCITRSDEEKAVLKSFIICTFALTVTAWWIVDWAMIAAGVLVPADGEYVFTFES